MKIYVSVDMEGATGIVSSLHVPGRCTSRICLRMYNALHDLQAVIEGASRRRGCKFSVNDSHAYDQCGCFAASSKRSPSNFLTLGMIEGTDGCDGVFFVGYHAMAGTLHAVLDHTIWKHYFQRKT